MYFPIFLPIMEFGPDEIDSFSGKVEMFLKVIFVIVVIIGFILITIKLIELITDSIINRLDKRRIKKEREKLIERTRENYENLTKSRPS